VVLVIQNISLAIYKTCWFLFKFQCESINLLLYSMSFVFQCKEQDNFICDVKNWPVVYWGQVTSR